MEPTLDPQLAVALAKLDPKLLAMLAAGVPMFEAFAELVAARISKRECTTEVWVSAEDNGLLTPRAFKEWARRGAFDTFKIGGKIHARKPDFLAWIERRKVDRKTRRAAPVSLDDRRAAKIDAAGYGTQKGAA